MCSNSICHNILHNGSVYMHSTGDVVFMDLWSGAKLCPVCDQATLLLSIRCLQCKPNAYMYVYFMSPCVYTYVHTNEYYHS